MHLAILGCGLLGTSVALAARAAGRAASISGFELSAPGRAAAEASGAYDRVEPPDGLAAGLSFDLGVAAVPPSVLPEAVGQLSAVCRVVVDTGSVKGRLLAALQAGAGVPAHFVPCHPMAGSERRGAAAGRADLFRERWVLLTPLPVTQGAAVAEAEGFWQALGARTERLAPERHDAAVGYTSHLPHLLTYAYMGVGDAPDAAVGPGFRDFARLAAADPALWADILLSNRAAWQPLLAGYRARLDEAEALFEAGDPAALVDWLAERRAQGPVATDGDSP